MDASPIQSGSKCGASDFSIERILSDRKESREDSADVPDWLCCTRYRPPRLPRAVSGSRARRAGRHARVPFTAAQAAALEAAYSRAPYLAPPALKALAAALQLRDDRIKIWFQNRRARERREKSVAIAPPQGVTLTPTTLATGFPPNWIPKQEASKLISSPINFINVQRFGTPLDYEDSKCRLKYEIPNRASFSSDESKTEIEDSTERPDTPLDIETVEV